MKRSDFLNFIALLSIQASNALVPIFIFPYALKVLGDEPYAKLATTEAIMIAALCLVLYSFEIDGVAQITKLDFREEKAKVSRIFSNIFLVRFSIFVFCLIAAGVSRPFLETTTSDLLFLWLLVPFSYILQSNFFFQAAERNIFIAVVTTISRLGAALLIFELVTEPSDVTLIPTIIGLSYLTAALLSFFYAKKYFGIKIIPTTVLEGISLLRYGWHVFIGNISVVLYRDLNVIFLGFVHADPTAVAAYSVSEKIVKGVQAAIRPLNQIVFPKVIRKVSSFECPNRETLSIILKYTWPQLVAVTITLLIIVAFCIGVFDFAVANIIKSDSSYKILILSALMLPSIYFGIANFMFGVVGLNYLNKRVYLYRAILLTGVISMISCLFLGREFGGVGAALTFTFSEAILFFIIIKIYSAGN